MRSAGRRLAAPKKKANEEAGEDELGRRRNAAAAMPAAEAVAGEELAPARSREAKDVLEVRRGSGERAADGRIERSARCGEEQDSGDTRADLEAAVGDVLVWHPIACEVEQQPERQRAESRVDERAADRTGGNVEGNDQTATLACCDSPRPHKHPVPSILQSGGNERLHLLQPSEVLERLRLELAHSLA
jgi:hypothetical protein